MQQQLLQHPLHIRCELISRWVDECTNKDLEYALPYILEDIFGITDRVGWDLLNLEYNSNPQQYDLLFNFLHPSGPMFRLCYKLLSDPYIKYKFHLSFLPQEVRQSIDNGPALSLYMEKLEVDPRTRAPMHLALNAFELYMFHFMYHVVNPCLRVSPYQESRLYLSLYLRLAEEYLSVFLPCDGSTVQPELPNHYISQSPHRSIPQKPVRTSTLFRQDVLVKILKQSPTVNSLQTSPHVGTWRSELVVQLCIDFWLSMPNPENQWGLGNPSSLTFSQQSSFSEPLATSTQMMWSEMQLPSCEHLHAVRILVKHLHYFANSLVEDSSAMDELKKAIITSSQRKVYHFIRQTMQHWPLDSSFKQILEVWLSYIQPWRYVDYKARYNRSKGEIMPVDSRWLPFIAENLLVYSVVFHQLIERFKIIDLASPRNAHMLFRLTKVFSQPNLCELLHQVEGSLGEMDGRGYSKWVRSHLLDFEGPNFQYKPIFSADSKTEEFIRMIKEAEVQAVVRLEEERQKEENMGFWERLFAVGESDKYTLNDRRNMPIFLSASIKNLINMFQIPEDSVDNIPKSVLNTTPLSSRPPALSEMSPAQMKNLDNFKYQGDPDLQPIRSYENAFLVRIFYHLCFWLNYNYSNQLVGWYMRRDVVGGVARQVLCGPHVVYHFDKRLSGTPLRVSTSLPPRLSLRGLANYHLLSYSALLFLLINLVFGMSLISISFVFLFLWLVVMVVRWALGYAPVEPYVSIQNFSDRTLNFSFDQ